MGERAVYEMWQQLRRDECPGCGRLRDFCDCPDREQWASGGEDESRDIGRDA